MAGIFKSFKERQTGETSACVLNLKSHAFQQTKLGESG